MATTTKKTTATTKATSGSDQYILVALPRSSTYSDGTPIRVVPELSLTEALQLMRGIHNKTAKNNLDESGNVMLIKGVLMPIKDDFSAVDVDGVVFDIIEKQTTYKTMVEVQ